VKECVIDMLADLTATCDVPMSQCFKVVQAVLKAADVKLLDTIESTSATTRAVLERALIDEYDVADRLAGVKELGLPNDGTSFWSSSCLLFVCLLCRFALSLSALHLRDDVQSMHNSRFALCHRGVGTCDHFLGSR
jgi:hypothetical protein